MDHFYLNGELWEVNIVPQNSSELWDRTGNMRVATTDPETHQVYLSEVLRGELFSRVLIHELGHCAMVSFGLLEEIHRMVPPEYWIDAEEFICNFIADYGMKIFQAAYSLFGEEAIRMLPKEIERLIV